MRDAVREADIIVTATGNCDIITSEHFPLMKDKAVLCNIGHFDDEIDMAWLNNNYGDSKINIKPQVDKYNIDGRSEEHTSELQSLMRISYAVFCLKKTTRKNLESRQPSPNPNHLTCH